MKFQDTRFWKNYKHYNKIQELSGMRSTVDAVIYWKLLNQFKSETFLEIGVYQGLTTGLFFESNPHAKVVAIDPVKRLKLFEKFYPEVQGSFSFINQSSQHVSLDNQQYDFILIDGDHSYQCARDDIIKCLPCLKPNSILAIDDYNMPGVAQAIQDLYNLNTDWVPFLQAEQTQFWHHKNSNRNEFLDSLLDDPISKFIFINNITDHRGNVICSAKTLNIFTDVLVFFDQALKYYNI